MTWDTFLTIGCTKGIYLVVVVAHKILVTSPEAKFLFPFWGLWALDWDLASDLSIIYPKSIEEDDLVKSYKWVLLLKEN